MVPRHELWQDWAVKAKAESCRGRAPSGPILTAAVEKGSWLSMEALPSNRLAGVTFV